MIIESTAELIFDDAVGVTLSTKAIVVRGALRLGSLKALTLRLLNALNSEDRGLKVRFFPCDDSV